MVEGLGTNDPSDFKGVDLDLKNVAHVRGLKIVISEAT